MKMTALTMDKFPKLGDLTKERINAGRWRMFKTDKGEYYILSEYHAFKVGKKGKIKDIRLKVELECNIVEKITFI